MLGMLSSAAIGQRLSLDYPNPMGRTNVPTAECFVVKKGLTCGVAPRPVARLMTPQMGPRDFVILGGAHSPPWTQRLPCCFANPGANELGFRLVAVPPPTLKTRKQPPCLKKVDPRCGRMPNPVHRRTSEAGGYAVWCAGASAIALAGGFRLGRKLGNAGLRAKLRNNSADRSIGAASRGRLAHPPPIERGTRWMHGRAKKRVASLTLRHYLEGRLTCPSSSGPPETLPP